MKIWKWSLVIGGQQTLMMPAGAKLLDVQMQGDDLCVWAMCDENAPPEPRHLAIYGTGHSLPDHPGEYIGTFQVSDLGLVFHLFEVAR